MTARRAVATVGVVIAVLGLWLVLPVVAEAHAYLNSSDPSDGQRLDVAPPRVTLVFSERPDAALSSVTVLNSAGAEVQAGPASNVPGEPLALQVPLPSTLPDGVYTVSWQIVSQVDGHQTSATFAFGVGQTPPPSGGKQAATAPPPGPLGIAGRTALLLGLSVLFAIGFDGLVVYRGSPPWRRLAAVAGSVAALLGVVAMVLAERSTLDVSLGTLLRSDTGRPLEWLAGATIAAAAAAAIVAIGTGRARLVALALLAGVAMLARVRGGHAAAGAAAWLEEGLQWAHVLAAGAWIGGLVLLVLRLGDEHNDHGDVARRFSIVATTSLAIVAVTGILRSSNELGWAWWLHPFRNGYGTTLAIKVGVATLLIALGTFNHYRFVPRVRDRAAGAATTLRRVVRGELVLAVGVFALTGTLTGLAPQNAPGGGPGSGPIVVTGSDFATTTRARLTVTPGTAGPNDFDLKLSDFDTGASAEVEAVTLRFDLAGSTLGATTLDLTRTGRGLWSGTGPQLSLDGGWDVTVLARRGIETLEIDLHINTRPPEQTQTVTSGTPPIYTLTVPSGESIQAYNDPGTAGPNELHLTAFDADGKELPLASASVTAIGPTEPRTALELRRLSAGHFVGGVTLTAGEWHFDLVATGENGDTIHVTFRQTI